MFTHCENSAPRTLTAGFPVPYSGSADLFGIDVLQQPRLFVSFHNCFYSDGVT